MQCDPLFDASLPRGLLKNLSETPCPVLLPVLPLKEINLRPVFTVIICQQITQILSESDVPVLFPFCLRYPDKLSVAVKILQF